MSRGSFNLAVSGMLIQQDNMSVIGNNIANSRTTGFKSNKMMFMEEFVTHSGQYINGTHNQYGNGVKSSGVVSDWGAGPIEGTNTASNLAIAGDGFFPVAYQSTIYYTRAGDFALVGNPNYNAADPNSPAYVFMRPNGAILLGGQTVDTATRQITGMSITSYVGFNAAPSSYEVNPGGLVSAIGASVIGVSKYIGAQRFNNPDSLQKIEGGMFKPTSLTSYGSGGLGAESPSQPGQNGAGTLMQGSLEQSNVDLVTEFTNMIITQRAFQANSKTITTSDEMLQTVMNIKR